MPIRQYPRPHGNTWLDACHFGILAQLGIATGPWSNKEGLEHNPLHKEVLEPVPMPLSSMGIAHLYISSIYRKDYYCPHFVFLLCFLSALLTSMTAYPNPNFTSQTRESKLLSHG